MRVLFLSNWYPYPPDNGSKARVFNLLRGLAEEHEVGLISFASHMGGRNGRPLEALCSSIRVITRQEFDPTSLSSAWALLGAAPRVIVDTHASAMDEAIAAEIASSNPELVIASQWNMAAYAASFDGTKALLEELELGSFESKVTDATSPLTKLRHTLTVVKMRRYIRSILPSFAACTVVSELEADLVRRAAGGYDSIEVIPNFVDLRAHAGQHGTSTGPSLVFAGSLNYFANAHGIDWFLAQAYESIRRAVPHLSLAITGKSDDAEFAGVPGVKRTGYVDDVRPLVASAQVSIVPIWLGGGTRLKVLEAMALRTPVVSTSKGVEGLDVVHDQHVLIADNGEDFANAVVRLLRDERLRGRIAESAYELVRGKYDYPVVMPKFLEVVERAARA